MLGAGGPGRVAHQSACEHDGRNADRGHAYDAGEHHWPVPVGRPLSAGGTPSSTGRDPSPRGSAPSCGGGDTLRPVNSRRLGAPVCTHDARCPQRVECRLGGRGLRQGVPCRPQCRCHARSGCVPLGHGRRERPADHLGQRRGRARDLGLPDDGLAPGERLEEDDADGIEVGPRGRRSSSESFRCQIGRRPDDEAHGGEVSPCRVTSLRGLEALGDAEVGELGRSVLGEEDVPGLDVPVDQSNVMCGLKCSEDIGCHSGGLDGRQRALGDTIGQGAAGEPLHHQVGQPAVDTRVVDLHDIWVNELRRGSCLLVEAPTHRGVVGKLGPELLDGDRPLQARVVAIEDAGGSPRPQERADPIAAGEQLFWKDAHARALPGATPAYADGVPASRLP